MTSSSSSPGSAAEVLASLPKRLGAARRERGVSVRQAAAQLGSSREAYLRWEHGQEAPRLPSVIRLLRWLGYEDVALGLEALPVLLYRTRRRRQLSWKQAAAKLGVDSSLLGRWERGEVQPDLAHTIRLLAWLEDAADGTGVGWPAYHDAQQLLRTLPQRLAAQRARLGLSTRQAAAQIGLPADTLGLLEHAKTSPQLDSALQVAAWLAPCPDAELAVLWALPRLARRARLRHGLTQAQLADAVGVSQPVICSLERRRSLPDLQTAVAVLGWLAALTEPRP